MGAYPEDPVRYLENLLQDVIQNKVATDIAKNQVMRMNRRTWISNWWKTKRETLIKNFCEICRTQTPPFTLQHTWHPPKYFDLIADYRRRNFQWEGSEQKKVRDDIQNLTEEDLFALDAQFLKTDPEYQSRIRHTCPTCKRLSPQYRKKDNKFVCRNCNSVWNEADLGFTAVKVIPYLKKKSWNEFERARQVFNDEIVDKVPKDVIVAYIEGSLRYLSLKDTITACKSCSYRMDHPGQYDLCPKCQVHYKKISFALCFECQQKR